MYPRQGVGRKQPVRLKHTKKRKKKRSWYRSLHPPTSCFLGSPASPRGDYTNFKRDQSGQRWTPGRAVFLHSLGSNELVFFPLSPPMLLKLLPENPLPRRQNTILRAARWPFGFKSGSRYNRRYPVEEKLNKKKKQTNKETKKKASHGHC